MRLAVRRARLRLAPAEMKFGLCRVADRPAAHPVIDRQNRRKTTVFQDDGIFFDDRRLLDVMANVPWRGRKSDPLGAGCRDTAGEAQAMDFADHGVTADPASHDPGDMTCRKALGPKRLQLLDALARPAHQRPPSVPTKYRTARE